MGKDSLLKRTVVGFSSKLGRGDSGAREDNGMSRGDPSCWYIPIASILILEDTGRAATVVSCMHFEKVPLREEKNIMPLRFVVDVALGVDVAEIANEFYCESN